jgi:hypothetical protein
MSIVNCVEMHWHSKCCSTPDTDCIAPKREEVAGGCRTLHNEGLHINYKRYQISLSDENMEN